MRILFLSHRYADLTIGGLAEFLHFLPRELVQLGHECFIYTQTEDKAAKSLVGPVQLDSGAKHYCGPFLKPKLFISKKELQPLIDFCEQKKIDLIHAQGTYRAGFMAMHIKKQAGIPYIITSHSDILEMNSKRIQRRSIQKRCRAVLKHAAFVTHLSPHMQQQSHLIFPTSAKETLIHNGIDLAAWYKDESINEEDYCLAIGRLEPEKGFHIIIDAYAKLLQKGIKTSLVIAGTGGMEAALKEQAVQLSLPIHTTLTDLHHLPKASVIFTGYVRGIQKIKLIKQAKLILFAPQYDEAFGIVQLEAMAAGKALIASDVAATRYLQTLGLQTALVNPRDNSANWADAMQMLLNDQVKCEKMGATNCSNINHFEWENVAKSYESVYKISTL